MLKIMIDVECQILYYIIYLIISKHVDYVIDKMSFVIMWL